MLDGYAASSLHGAISELPGGLRRPTARLSIGCAHSMPLSARRSDTIRPSEGRFIPRLKMHSSRLSAAFNPHRPSSTHGSKSKAGGWGGKEAAALRHATAESYELAIKSLEGESLENFIRKNVDIYVRRARYATEFGDAMENVAEACRSIWQENTSCRLTRLIRLLFTKANIGSALDAGDVAPPIQPEAQPPS